MTNVIIEVENSIVKDMQQMFKQKRNECKWNRKCD
jgi:hypothetical protein